MEENEKLPQRRRQRWRNFTETTNTNNNNDVFDSTSTPKAPTEIKRVSTTARPAIQSSTSSHSLQNFHLPPTSSSPSLTSLSSPRRSRGYNLTKSQASYNLKNDGVSNNLGDPTVNPFSKAGSSRLLSNETDCGVKSDILLSSPENSRKITK